MTSLIEIARELGLSKSTVSRALRGLPEVAPATVAAVRAVAERDGYIPSVAAAGLSTGRHRAIGVVVPTVTRWFYTTVLSGIDAALNDTGFDVVLFDLSRHGREGRREFHRSFLRHRVDGIIVLSTEFSPAEYEQLASVGVPTIAIGGPTFGMRRIGVDDRAIGRAATEHLIGLGHTRIGIIGGYDDEGLNRRVPDLRLLGWQETLAEASLPMRPDWVLSGRFRMAPAYDEVRRFLSGTADRPTAFVCMSDEVAIGAMRAAQDEGLHVPEDLSIIGIDGHDYARVFGLTSCEQKPAAHGALAAEHIVSETLGRTPLEAFEDMPFELVVRGTTAPPAH